MDVKTKDKIGELLTTIESLLPLPTAETENTIGLLAALICEAQSTLDDC